MIDYRSDTVTKPSKEMLEAMFNAKVGDDVYQEDPTVNELQDFAADFFGMEAALFCSSGTQSNQIGINIHVQRGGEVICHEESHIYKYEGGGIAKNSGASVRLLPGSRGRLTVTEIQKAVNADDIHFAVTELVSLEDTANRGGGAVYDFEEIKKISIFCKEKGIPLHLDGARMMNALEVNKVNPKVYAAQFDSISICLSKGLGAPVGSLLLGTKEFIRKARRVRKVMGGGMRQAGVIAAGGLYAMQHHIERLKEDRIRAAKIGELLLQQNWVSDVFPVETNIIVFSLTNESHKMEIIQKFKEHGILVSSFGENMIRIVIHLDITDQCIDETCKVISSFKN